MDIVARALALFPTLVLFAYFAGCLASCIRFWALPRSISVPGAKDNGIFSRTRAYLIAWVSYHRSRTIAYTTFARLGKPFISPSPSLSPDIVIPPAQVKWLLSQPSSVLAQRPALWEGMAIKYMFPSADQLAEFVPNLVKRHMSSSNVDILQSEMYQEIRHWTDIRLSTNGDWHEVSLFEAIGFILRRTGYRIYFGPELSKNETLVNILQTLSNLAAIGGLVIGQFSPPLLRKPLGYLFQIPISYYTWRFKSIWEPALRIKLQSLLNREARRTSDVANRSATTGAAESLLGSTKHTVESISSNFMIMYGVASNVKVPGSLSLLLNLITLPEAQTYLPLLRQEVDEVFAMPSAWENPDTFTPNTIPLTMAFMRESMRYSPLTANIPVRTVVAKEGVVLPDGTHVPRGSWLTCPAESMARDDQIYCDPDIFDPFRFLQRVSEDTNGTGKISYALQPDSDVTIAKESFLYFGYGKHFCPGRFFMTRVMLVLLTYIVKHYDFEPVLKDQPQPIRAGFVNLPPLATKVKFRRRKDSFV